MLYKTCFILVVLASTAIGGFTSSSLSGGAQDGVSRMNAHKMQQQPSERTQLSIWLVPPEPQRSELQEIIHKLAESHGGPTFTPHITIVGSVQASTELEERAVVEKLRRALHQHSKVNCSFLPNLVSFRDTWNQALIAKLDPTTDDDFYQLCLDVRAALDMPVKDWSFPPPAKSAHLSFFYGVGNNVPVLEDGDVVDEGVSITPVSPFQAHQISIIRIVSSLDSVPDWWCIATIDFDE